MTVIIQEAELYPWEELRRHENQHTNKTKIGACATFVGTMRDFNEDLSVQSMYLEYYPGMTEKQLEKILNQQIRDQNLENALIIHRVGQINPAETIVLVAAWSAHRKQAFDACRNMMEALKQCAPFWKHETTNKGQHWVSHNTKS